MTRIKDFYYFKAMIKYGFQSSKYDNLTLEQELSFASHNSIEFFDIFFDDFCPNDIKNLELPENFSVSLPYHFATFSENGKKQYIDFIKEKKPLFVSVPFVDFSLEELLALASEIKKIPLCIENTVDNFNRKENLSYADFMEKLNQLSKEKKLSIYSTFDTGHAKISSSDAVGFLKNLLDKKIKIYAVQFHDNDGKKDSHWSSGSVNNGIDFAEILRLLNSCKNDIFGVIAHWNNNYNALEYLKSL